MKDEHPSSASGAKREKLNALPYDLVPFQEIADSYARVAEKGAIKYAPWNWSMGLSRVQLLGSLLRHTFAYLRGEEIDGGPLGTGLKHTDHILWNAVSLVHNVRWNLEDGRRAEPPRAYKMPLPEGFEALIADECDPAKSLEGIKAYIRTVAAKNRITAEQYQSLYLRFGLDHIDDLKPAQFRRFLQAIQMIERHDQ